MISEKSTNKYKDSRMKEIYIDADKQNGTGISIKAPPDCQIIPNSCFASNGISHSCFFFDKSDLDWLKSSAQKNQLTKHSLENLKEFVKIRPEKRIYLRYFPLTADRIEKKRVLPEDVLEVIPLVLMQRKTPISGDDERLEKLREKWIRNRESEFVCGITIDTEELENILEAFDVNKELITLINDPFYTAYMKDHLNCGTKPITFPNATVDHVMFPSQALLYIFQSFVFKINWQWHLSRADSQNVEYLRLEILKYLVIYDTIDSDCLVRQTDLDVYIDQIETVRKRVNVDQEPYWNAQFTDSTNETMIGTFFRQECVHYGLRNFAVYPDGRNHDFIMGSSAKLYLLLAWIECFLDDDMVSIRDKLMDAMVYKIEKSARDSLLKFWDTVPSLKPLYKESMCRNYRLDLKTVRENDFGVYGGDYDIIGNLAPNTVFFKRKEWEEKKIKFFILDKEDINSVNSILKNEKIFGNRLDSLTKYLNHKPKKRIYIRSVSMVSDGKEVRRVSTEEVLEIIPLVLKQQSCPIFSNNDRLKKYREQWKSVENGKIILTTTIDMDEFVKVLEEFDINKDLITVVTDLSHEVKSVALFEDGCTPITFISHDCQPVMFTGQALLHLFNSVICGVNWRIKRDIGEYDQMIRSLVLKYSEMDKNLLITKKTVVEDITNLLIHRPPELKPLPSEGFTDYKLQNVDSHMNISNIAYLQTCESFALPCLTGNGRTDLPLFCYIARLSYSIGCVQNFFKPEDVEIKNRLKNELLWKAEKCVWSNFYECMTHEFSSQTSKLDEFWTNFIEKDETEHADNISRLADRASHRAQQLQEKKDAKTMQEGQSVRKQTEDIVTNSGNSQHVTGAPAEKKMTEISRKIQENVKKFGESFEVDENKKINLLKTSSIGEIPKAMTPKVSPVKESSSKGLSQDRKLQSQPVREQDTTSKPSTAFQLEKSLEPSSSPLKNIPIDRTDYKAKFLSANEHNSKAQKERDLAVKKAERFEDKAKKYDELERKMKELKIEKEELERNIATQVKFSEENERLRLKITSREEIEKQLRASRNEYQQKAESFVEENTRLVLQSEDEKDKHAEMKKKWEDAKAKTREVNKEWAARIVESNNEVSKLNEYIKKKEEEVLTKDKSNEILRKTNIGAMKINKDLIRKNEILESRLATAMRQSTPAGSPNVSQAPSASEDPKVAQNPRKKLDELRKMKDKFSSERIMKEANGIVEKLKSVSEDKELIDLAEFEMIRLEKVVRIYEDTLATNLFIFKKTLDISQLLPMQYPSLSSEFMRKYSDLMISITTEVPDSDCLICHEIRVSHEKTIECETTCHKIYHLKCASGWFKQQQTCPHCRSRMLDDEEYPAL